GSVGGDVVSYGGDVIVNATGRVGGHILASAGVLHQSPGAIVAGQKINGGAGEALASLLDLLDPTNLGDADDTLGHALFGVALAVLLAAFCLLYTAFWPGRIALAGDTLGQLPGRALMLGLLTTLALALALYVYGLVVLARMLSTRVALPAPSGRMVAITLALVLLIAVVGALAPLWGLALFFLAASPGLGAVVLSRGGMAHPLAVRPLN
ncbi:MAG: hypothetical protein ABIV47_01445, partial [Roseiflexaceae bacterium]